MNKGQTQRPGKHTALNVISIVHIDLCLLCGWRPASCGNLHEGMWRLFVYARHSYSMLGLSTLRTGLCSDDDIWMQTNIGTNM